MDAKIYNTAGEQTSQIELPAEIFGLPWNGDLVHQVVVAMQANQRAGTAHTKDRGEVRGGGKKPWRQKGTGRARHGSIRSPLWRGGGVTHGPRREKNYEQKINKRMKTKALFTVFSQKQRDGEVLFLAPLHLVEPKTKTAAATLAALARVPGFEKVNYRRGRRTLLTLPNADAAVWKSFRNLPGTTVSEARNLNPELLLNYQYLIISDPQTTLPLLAGRAKGKHEKAAINK